MADGIEIHPNTGAIPPVNTNNEVQQAPANQGSTSAVSTFASALRASLPSSNDVDATATDKFAVCANCGSPATRRCLGCISDADEQGNADEPSTYYCDKNCQSENWKIHQPQCKLAVDRRQLFRLGRLVQWAFYRSIKAMWYDRILEVKRTRDTEADDGAQLQLWRCKKHDLSNFPAFAEGSFSNVYGEKLEEYDKQAVLATSACTGAIVCGLMRQLVEGESQYCLMMSYDHR
jgi:hypothetical protein